MDAERFRTLSTGLRESRLPIFVVALTVLVGTLELVPPRVVVAVGFPFLGWLLLSVIARLDPPRRPFQVLLVGVTALSFTLALTALAAWLSLEVLFGAAVALFVLTIGLAVVEFLLRDGE